MPAPAHSLLPRCLLWLGLAWPGVAVAQAPAPVRDPGLLVQLGSGCAQAGAATLPAEVLRVRQPRRPAARPKRRPAPPPPVPEAAAWRAFWACPAGAPGEAGILDGMRPLRPT